ncbi:MAG: DUF4349 domain-containing protein [Bacteroidota bacterium]
MIRYSTFLLFIFLFSSCVSRKLYDQQSTGATTVNYELRQEADLEESYDEFLADRLIIYTAYISVVVKGLEEQREKLQSFVKQHQAYVESSSTNSWTIRVPQDSFNSLLAQIETLGEVNNKNLYSQDVTDQYRDTEIRLETLEKSRQRYLELLNKAEKVSEILEIERELERINVEIESMKGQLKRLDSKVQYATITVSLQEKIKPGPLGVVGVGLYKVLKWLFVWN